MFSKSLDIDIQIHQEEIKKPIQSSIILIPLINKSEIINQLTITFENLDNKFTPHNVDQVAKKVFAEWKTTFPLYSVERAFADMSTSQRIELYITFNATNIFSNTQTRNIKRTVVDILRTELNKILETASVGITKKRKEVSLNTDQEIEAEKRRVDFELREQFSHLKKENSELQMALQQSKVDELAQKESIGALRLELEKQQRSLTGLSESHRYSTPEVSNSYLQVQDKMDDVSYRLRQSQQESLDKQREVQRLQSIVSENERYINNLQIDYDQLRESNNIQLKQYIEENDNLKTELFNYKDDELTRRQEVQQIKSELRQIISDTENIQEAFKQKLQLMQYENDELRTVINENQKFEERTHQELLDATRDLGDARDAIHRLEKEKAQEIQELELKYNRVSSEKKEIETAYANIQELEFSHSNELVELKNHLIGIEQGLQQAELEKRQLEATWQNRLIEEENDKERLIAQATIDKDQFVRNKEQEIKRLTDRLEQQKQLVDKLMANQSDSQTIWQDNYANLESNYRNAKEKSDQLEADLRKLTDENQTLLLKISLLEEQAIQNVPVVVPEATTIVTEFAAAEVEPEAAIVEVEPTEEEDLIIEVEDPAEIVAILEEEMTYDDESEADSEYGYDDDEDYDYDYDDDDYDYDYEYHEVDDLVNYDPDNIESDVKELLSNKDESGKEKISKKDFAIYELYLDNLEDLVEQADGQEFKAFAETKLKKYNRFKKEFEDGVKSPTLFSRKYKLETGLANQMKAFVLISRHLSILLDIELSDSDEYDYGYDYDYDYEDDYDYDEDDYDYEEFVEEKKSKKSKK